MNNLPLTAARAEEVWDALARDVRPGARIEADALLAAGCVLAADVRCRNDFPAFDRAMMDGYAVRSADLAGGNRRLQCVGLIRAGGGVAAMPVSGQCVQINTGAVVPGWADSVVQVEHTREVGDDVIEFDESPTVGLNIERRGAVLREGALLLRGGSRITPGAVSALAAAGAPRVTVFARPRVAILSTGDEIIAVGQTASAGQIHDSNTAALMNYCRDAGSRPISLGRCADDSAILRSKLEEGLTYDVLLVTGGMSKGTHDLVPDALESLGVEWVVKSLNLKPGKPTRIGRTSGGTWVMGLPGNPVSCAVCFLLFGRPLLDGLCGLPIRPPPHIDGELDATMPENGGRPMYHPAEWHFVGKGRCRVTPLAWRGSGDPFGMISANALVHREAHAPRSDRGETVRFVALDVPT